MSGKNLMIMVNGTAVEVTDSFGTTGFCFDYFNDNSTAFLEGIFSDAQFDFSVTGMWLYHNTPAFVSTNYTGKPQPASIDPFS